MTLLELLDLMKKRIKLVIGLPIVCALLIGVYSFMFMPDTYTATTSMYVLTNQEQSAGNLSTDLSASQMVANDVTTLLNSNRVRKATADDLGLKSLKDFEIEVTSATDVKSSLILERFPTRGTMRLLWVVAKHSATISNFTSKYSIG